MERRILQEIQALHEIADTVWSARTTNEVLQAATDRVALLMGADQVSTITFELERRQIRDFVKGGPGSSRGVTSVEYDELESGLSGWVLQSGKAALSPKGVPDLRETPDVQARRATANSGCILVVPLRHRDQLFGTMTAINTATQPDFTVEDQELMTLFANYCAMVIDNARVLLDLRTAKEAAESSNRAKSEFLGLLSHELRTPLNAIIGFTHLLGFSELDDSQRDFTKAIGHGGEALLEVVNNILDLARIEAGQINVEDQPYQLETCFANAIVSAGPLFEAKGLKFEAYMSPTLSGYLLGDEARLRQVLINLLSNAAKFTARGSVSLSAIHDRTPGQGQQIVLEVEDTGIGIPADKIGRLFKPFSQVDGSKTREHGGTGLGLAISRSLVQLMRGEIAVDSAVGRGSVFRVSLPLRRAQAGPDAAEQGVQLRVLLVEDDALNQIVVTKMLQSLGHTVEVVPNGDGALRVCLSKPYDVVFMDLAMPSLDGLETTKRIRALEAQSTESRGPLYILALTALTRTGDRESCLEAGMDGYLTKPLGMATLKAQLELVRPR
jgi:signal transduction histidine kinase/ActR/RegA family two-component response regulator